MKYLVWGTSLNGIATVNILKALKEEVVAIIDNNPKQQGKVISDIKVCSFESIYRNIDWNEVCIIISAANSRNIYQIMDQIKDKGCRNIAIMKPSVQTEKFRRTIEKTEDFIVWAVKSGIDYRIIPRIEVNLIDGCNLKCKGCTHFSSIFSIESIYPLQQYKEDLESISLTGRVVRLRLLGGEPLLLQDELIDYLSVARKIFPDSDIELVSNGLLIPKLSIELLESIRVNGITVIISPYAPTMKMEDKISDVLEHHSIAWRFDGEAIKEFSRNLTLQKVHKADIASKVCMSYGCTFLRLGKLYKCPFDGLFEELCKHYNIDSMLGDSGVNVRNRNDDLYDEIRTLALEPVEMCQFCSEELEMIPWEVKNSPALEDWLYCDGKK